MNIKLLNKILQTVDGESFNQYYKPIFRPNYEDRYNSYSRDSDHLPVDVIVPELKQKMRNSLNNEIIKLLSFLEYNHIYVDDFFEWCLERHESQFISIIETILETGNDIEKETIKRIIRDLSNCKIEKNDSLQERWKSIQEKCEYRRTDSIDLENITNEKLKELLQQFELWEEN